jgi:hypothetical protein
MNRQTISTIALLMCLFTILPTIADEKKVASGPAFANKISSHSLSPNMVSTSKSSPASLKMNALHRLDFIVTGTSCATCLLRVQRRLEAAPGVAKVAVMLRKPNAGVCIYDSTKQDKAKLLSIGTGNEKNIGFEKVEDTAVPRIPLVLVPRHAMESSVTSSAQPLQLGHVR